MSPQNSRKEVMKKFGLVLCASLTLATTQAFADDRTVTLVARDGTLTIQANLMWYESGKICVETALGELIFLERDMVCLGEACQTD